MKYFIFVYLLTDGKNINSLFLLQLEVAVSLLGVEVGATLDTPHRSDPERWTDQLCSDSDTTQKSLSLLIVYGAP